MGAISKCQGVVAIVLGVLKFLIGIGVVALVFLSGSRGATRFILLAYGLLFLGCGINGINAGARKERTHVLRYWLSCLISFFPIAGLTVWDGITTVALYRKCSSEFCKDLSIGVMAFLFTAAFILLVSLVYGSFLAHRVRTQTQPDANAGGIVLPNQSVQWQFQPASIPSGNIQPAVIPSGNFQPAVIPSGNFQPASIPSDNIQTGDQSNIHMGSQWTKPSFPV